MRYPLAGGDIPQSSCEAPRPIREEIPGIQILRRELARKRLLKKETLRIAGELLGSDRNCQETKHSSDKKGKN